MKPILAIALFALVCISHQIQSANASRIPFPLNKLRLLNPVKRQVVSGATEETPSFDDSTQDSSSADTSSSAEDDTSSGVSGSAGMPGEFSEKNTPASSTSTTQEGNPPCDDSEQTGKNPGIMGQMENGIGQLTSSVMHGTETGVEEATSLAGTGVSTLASGMKTVVTLPINAMIYSITLPVRIIEAMFGAAKMGYDFTMKMLGMGWNLIRYGSMSAPAKISARSIRAIGQLAHPIMVSSYDNLVHSLELLLQHLANAPPEEREGYIRTLRNVWCELSDQFGFNGCDAANDSENLALNNHISWQVGIEDSLVWAANHLKMLVDFGLISPEREGYMLTFLQTLRTLVKLIVILEGN